MLESSFLVPAAKRARLERSWAHGFRQHILPLIDEELFRPCFAHGRGRPNRSIRLLVGLELLKHADDLTDLQVLDALEFNIQWQYALGVEPGDAHIAERTLHAFRKRLIVDDRAQALFQQLTEALVRIDGLSTVRQRLDSTHVLSNIRRLTRLTLFTETVTHFLRALRAQRPDLWAELAADYGPRYLDREGYFCDVRREEAKRRLPLVAQDLYALVLRFKDDGQIRTWESYLLLDRLLREQCDVTEAEAAEPARVAVKNADQIQGESLQSPHDADATYGHKGKGYLAHVTETCVEGNPYQLITDTRVNGAHVSDQHATAVVVEDLRARGLQPQELLADTGYGSGENIVQCAELGTELVAPVQDPNAPAPTTDACWTSEPEPEPEAEAPAHEPATAGVEPVDAAVLPAEPPLGLADFTYTTTFDAVLRCPAGLVPIGRAMNETAVPYEAIFDGARCADCPLVGRCPTRPRNRGAERVLKFRDVKAATASRQAEQRSPAFKERYKLRSGVESTNAELKTRHGLGRLRVRGRERVVLTVTLKALALNAKRAAAWHSAARSHPTTPQGDRAEMAEAA